MVRNKLLVKISGQQAALYDSIESVFADLKLIDNKIELEDTGDGYVVKYSTISKITRLENQRAKDRLARVCMAIEFDVPFKVYIDDNLKFASIYELCYLLLHITTNNDNSCNLDFFKDKIAEALDNNLDISKSVEDYQNARLIADIINDYNEDQEDPFI